MMKIAMIRLEHDVLIREMSRTLIGFKNGRVSFAMWQSVPVSSQEGSDRVLWWKVSRGVAATSR